MIFKDYYKILGLDEQTSDINEIKIAYREQAKKYHPDVNVGNKSSEERFKDINEAYKVLSDAAAKKKYDRMWNSTIGKKREKKTQETKSKDTMFGDFLNMFFGKLEDKEGFSNKKNIKKENNVTKGENINTEVNVSLEDAFFGLEKKISLRMVNGKMKTFNIKIPAGIRNGEKIRLIGQGKKGENGGKNGDLLIKVNIENNSRFKLDGYNIFSDLLITPWEAALGTKIEMDTIDEKITIIVPKGTQSGEKLAVQGKGYKKENGQRGDFIAVVKIMVPKKLTEKEEKLFKELKNISEYIPRKNYA